MSNYFAGDKELAKTLLVEIEKIEKITEKCANLVSQKADSEQKTQIIKGFLRTYALICSEVEMPIYKEFPELDRDK